jgi:GT2 family glycosyltransferase/glycosyltransferase involved in cell wall biosynthesis
MTFDNSPSDPNNKMKQVGHPGGDQESFDEIVYLSHNPDVAAAVDRGEFSSGIEHWLQHGRSEILSGSRRAYERPDDFHYETTSNSLSEQSFRHFDSYGYRYLNPDIDQTIGKDPAAALIHWMQHGRFEGRLGPGVARYFDRRTTLDIIDRPFGVNLYAPFSLRSALTIAARGYYHALRAAQIPVQVFNVDWSSGTMRIARSLFGIRGKYRTNLMIVNADTISKLYTVFPPGQFDDAYNIGLWAWELSAFRPEDFLEFGIVDEVWGMSDFVTAAIGAVSPIPVMTVHNVVELEESGKYTRDDFNLPKGRFLFYCPFDVGSSLQRKNPFAVVHAFKRAFEGNGKVHLVVKYHSPKHNYASVRKLFEVCRGLSNVSIISEFMPDKKVAGLLSVMDCLVSAHRSEGFGRNMAEALLLEIPVIATRYSGNVDFMDDTNSYLIKNRLTEITATSGPYLRNYLWGDPDFDHLGQLMLEVFSNPGEARERAQRGAKMVRSQLSRSRIGGIMRARLEELGLNQEVPRFLRSYGKTKALYVRHPISTISAADRNVILQLKVRPVISLIVPVYNVPPAYLECCIQSVLAQNYPFWELCLVDDASTNRSTVDVLNRYQGSDPRIRIVHLAQNKGISGASNRAIELATGEYLAMLDNDDTIAPNALLEIAMAVNEDPSIDCIYTDEDKLDESENHIDHYFKPDWSPEHLESVMYVLHLLIVRKSLFLAIGGFRPEFTGAQDYDLMLRISRATNRIHHIPKILYNWRMIPGSAAAQVDAKPAALDNARLALVDHVTAKYGDKAWVEPGLLMGTFRVRQTIEGNPPVSVLITTNNSKINLPKRGEFTMIDNLLRSIVENTSYKNFSVIVVDNSNSTSEQLRQRKRLGVRTISYQGPMDPFNFSHKANFGIGHIDTENVVLLNDDMEVINEGWLTALLELSQREDVGIVGCKLYHDDGTLQHCGVVLGVNDGAAHIYHSFPGDHIGYNGFTHLIRNYSAVTGACLATRKSVLAQVGGYDEDLAIDFNDIDLCLRVGELGYRIVYTPFAEMYHFESKTIERKPKDRREVELFQSSWRKYLAHDPYYNRNLSRNRIDYTINTPDWLPTRSSAP